jgi:exodeoxyribonuclease VII small subunit
MTDANMTFRQAYGVLQRHAETLRNQTEPNIDDLLPMVEESVAAYRVCKERIDAVEKALEKALTDVATDGAPRAPGEELTMSSAPPGRASKAAAPTQVAAVPKSGFDEMDDDIPF